MQVLQALKVLAIDGGQSATRACHSNAADATANVEVDGVSRLEGRGEDPGRYRDLVHICEAPA